MPPRGRVVKTRAHDTKSASEAYFAHTWTYPGHFGRGSTAAEAVSNLRGHAGGSFLRTHGYVVFRVHPETTVNHDGQLLWPLPHKPVLVENKLKHDADLSEFDDKVSS